MKNAEERQLDEIIPGLYLGNYEAAKSLETLQKHSITHILVNSFFNFNLLITQN